VSIPAACTPRHTLPAPTLPSRRIAGRRKLRLAAKRLLRHQQTPVERDMHLVVDQVMELQHGRKPTVTGRSNASPVRPSAGDLPDRGRPASSSMFLDLGLGRAVEHRGANVRRLSVLGEHTDLVVVQ